MKYYTKSSQRCHCFLIFLYRFVTLILFFLIVDGSLPCTERGDRAHSQYTYERTGTKGKRSAYSTSGYTVGLHEYESRGLHRICKVRFITFNTLLVFWTFCNCIQRIWTGFISYLQALPLLLHDRKMRMKKRT